MFYVGTCSSFVHKDKAPLTKVSHLEKLGHSRGRAARFLKEHQPIEINGAKHRAVVFELPESFRLRNDWIQTAIKLYRCTWIEAKFHIYREAAANVLIEKPNFPELFPDPASTALLPEPVSETAGPDANTEAVAPVATLVQ